MGWEMPWYSARDSLDVSLAGRGFGGHLCYLRDGDRVFERYWTTSRGTDAVATTYHLLDLTVYGAATVTTVELVRVPGVDPRLPQGCRR
jgi:predicted dithiol-disulfide oxidoreductase (DUF899 family)